MSEGVAAGSAGGRARVEIDLGALRHNFRGIVDAVAPAGVLPVVKADAYGHGAVEVARALEPLGVAGFAVARVGEGVELRRGGARAPILVCSPAHPDTWDEMARHDLSPVLSSLEQIDAVVAAARAGGWRPSVHLKVDSGMHRLGVPSEEVDAAFDRLRRSAEVTWSGLLSHLADGEHPESTLTASQQRTFAALVERLTPVERARISVHLANSAGALTGPALRHDLVRPGWALFGGGIEGCELRTEPVLALHARILQIQQVAAGESIGYGGRWTAPRSSRVGVVGIGYADGYPWRAGGRARALVGGRRVEVIGAVSMDLLAVDLTGLGAPGPAVDDEVTLIGAQGGERIRVEELAAWSGTIGWELLCHMRLRLPRVFLDAGGTGAEAPGRAVTMAAESAP